LNGTKLANPVFIPFLSILWMKHGFVCMRRCGTTLIQLTYPPLNKYQGKQLLGYSSTDVLWIYYTPPHPLPHDMNTVEKDEYLAKIHSGEINALRRELGRQGRMDEYYEVLRSKGAFFYRNLEVRKLGVWEGESIQKNWSENQDAQCRVMISRED
jgi:hypothetical protein